MFAPPMILPSGRRFLAGGKSGVAVLKKKIGVIFESSFGLLKADATRRATSMKDLMVVSVPCNWFFYNQ